MIFIYNEEIDAEYNLAFEECLLKHFHTKKNIVCIWQNKKAVIIGRNQNYHHEVNSVYLDNHDIQCVRRNSGGGAVFHDLGNVNFTFISNLSDDATYKKMTAPIIDCLNKLGVPAKFTGRNDITVHGKKISGNAQYVYQDRIMHHGTILFDVNFSMLSACLNPDKRKLITKGIPSVRARVTNIKPLLLKKMNVQEFISLIKQHFLKQGYESIEVDDTFKGLVQELVNKKYALDSWNINTGPEWKFSDFTFHHTEHFEGGLLSISAQILGGRIQSINFHGDFLSRKDPTELNEIFVGAKQTDLEEILASFKIQDYFGNLTSQQVMLVFQKIFKKAERNS